MNAPGHRMTAVVAGAYVGAQSGELLTTVGWTLGAVITSAGVTSPDVDRLWDSTYNHRGAVHWFGWPLLVWLYLDVVLASLPPLLALAFPPLLLGWAVHLAGDFVFGRLPVLPWKGAPKIGVGL